MPADRPFYSNEHIAAIRAAARSNGLDSIHCPRDGSRLDIYGVLGRTIERGEPAQGVLYGDFQDVHHISVECSVCHYGAVAIDLTGE